MWDYVRDLCLSPLLFLIVLEVMVDEFVLGVNIYKNFIIMAEKRVKWKLKV